MSHHMVQRPYDLSTMASALRAANDGPPVFRTLDETRERTAALRMHVDSGMIPLYNDDPEPITKPKDDESRIQLLEKKVARHEKRINDLVDYSKMQTCSLEHLFSVVNSLQAASELYIDRAIPQAVRRRLDDSCFHLATGFMVVLPFKFNVYRLLLDWDRTGDFLNWSMFTDTVNNVYNEFHDWFHHSREGWYRYQRHPLLSICYPDQLLETKGATAPFVPVVCPGVITNRPVGIEENHWSKINKMDSDDINIRSVHFFLPALIWGYNELKRALLLDEAKISDAEFDVELQHLAAMQNLDDAALPVRRDFGDIHEQFKTGTGQSAREQPYWRDRLARIKEMEDQIKAQNEYDAARRGHAGGWAVGRGVAPVRPDASRGGSMVIQGTAVFVGVGGQAAPPVPHARTPSPTPSQDEGNGGNELVDWHRSRRNPTIPPPDGDAPVREELEQPEIDPAEATARGALPNIPLPVPDSEDQRVEGTVMRAKAASQSSSLSSSPDSQNALELATAVRNQNAEEALQKKEARLQECLALYNIHRDKFDKVCRALGIMCDEELFEITVAGKVRVRVNTNYGHHLRIEGKSKVVKDLLARADQMEKGIPYQPGDRVPNPTDASYGEQVTKLNELLIREDFFENHSDLEHKVDDTLSKAGAGGLFSSMPEMGGLLRYLDRLGPSSS